jgi:hypothetical protein
MVGCATASNYDGRCYSWRGASWILTELSHSRLFSRACSHIGWQLERVDEGHHPLALVGVGQLAAHGAEIVRHGRCIGCAGDDGGHSRVTQ